MVTANHVLLKLHAFLLLKRYHLDFYDHLIAYPRTFISTLIICLFKPIEKDYILVHFVIHIYKIYSL
jgi:hypothetical protein